MAAWFSEWLRNIIAIILLAVVADMLLPNKAMQRYARLTIGLIILLVLLSPVLKILREDIGTRLEGAIAVWDASIANEKIKMPRLEDIQKKGEAMKENQLNQALRLTEQTIENAMLEQLNAYLNDQIHAVKVKLDLTGGEQQAPTVQSAIITVKKVVQEPKGKAKNNQDQHDQTGASTQEKLGTVEPVMIDIATEISRIELDKDSDTAKDDVDAESIENNVDQKLAEKIKQYAALHWEVSSRVITVVSQ